MRESQATSAPRFIASSYVGKHPAAFSSARGITNIGVSGASANGPTAPLRREVLIGVIAICVPDPSAGEACSVRGVVGDGWAIAPSALAPTVGSTLPLVALDVEAADAAAAAVAGVEERTCTVDTGASAKASAKAWAGRGGVEVAGVGDGGLLSPIAPSAIALTLTLTLPEGEGGTGDLSSAVLAASSRRLGRGGVVVGGIHWLLAFVI